MYVVGWWGWGGGVGGCDVSLESHVEEIDNLLKNSNALTFVFGNHLNLQL